MSMNTALSGLTAAQSDIAATSHNIANVGTIGFRGSRTEFADIYNQSPFSVSRTTVGSGTQVTRVAQDFSQGSIVGTGNRLDLAIEGAGFFALRPTNITPGATAETLYSRAGAFGLSADGTIVNASGQQLLGWPVAMDGHTLSEALGTAMPLKIPLAMGFPAATSRLSMELSLPTDPAMAGAQEAVPPSAPFAANDPTTWAHRTNVPMFDAEGRSIEAELYLVRTSNPSEASPNTSYEVHLVRDGIQLEPGAAQQVTFGADGALVDGSGALSFSGSEGTVSLSLADSVLRDRPFQTRSASHNGQTQTQLTTLDIDSKGTVWAVYGSEERVAQGKLLLVNFSNPGGLRVMGAAAFAATTDSGLPMAGSPGGSGFGLLRSGALEKANVDLTEELVNLITAQRNYQASAKAMETSSSMMQTIMNLRS
ncbi:flagellar hook protein FlgE [Pseudotabrizicola algicola]|uniref:Flagellar hook protein FlgE n=1 Tax=Pseudotabrizicola algicola TaxID=2709381 RepID=A0A6B3RK28_9RHOB|nr:flagellar hook protein FlgE [Pseudotabrizicola algicola]NEX45248.1 flagellar hook protein FlgE [Pseudotabrizicola algicola]